MESDLSISYSNHDILSKFLLNPFYLLLFIHYDYLFTLYHYFITFYIIIINYVIEELYKNREDH